MNELEDLLVMYRQSSVDCIAMNRLLRRPCKSRGRPPLPLKAIVKPSTFNPCWFRSTLRIYVPQVGGRAARTVVGCCSATRVIGWLCPARRGNPLEDAACRTASPRCAATSMRAAGVTIRSPCR